MYLVRKFIRIAAAVCGLSLPLAGALPALANSTPGCQAAPGCVEPVVAIAATSANDFNQPDDAALSVFFGGTVYTRQNNSLDNGAQDWQFVRVGRVPFFFGDGGYGLTAFDRFAYGGDNIYQLQWVPRGDDSANLCLNIRYASHLGFLADCDGRKGEAFIVTRNVPGLLPPAAAGYTFALSVRQAGTTARHQLLTANDTGFGQVFVQNKVLHSAGVATNQMWSALP